MPMRSASSAGTERAQHGERAGAGIAHRVRQEPGAAEIGDQRDAHEGLVEAGRAGGQDDVAGQREVGAAARRHAVDRADDRLGQRAHGADHGIEDAVHVGAEIGRRRRPPHRPCRRPRDRRRRRSRGRCRSAARRGSPASSRARASSRFIASIRALFMAFSRCGRLSVRVSTPPSRADRTGVSSIGRQTGMRHAAPSRAIRSRRRADGAFRISDSDGEDPDPGRHRIGQCPDGGRRAEAGAGRGRPHGRRHRQGGERRPTSRRTRSSWWSAPPTARATSRPTSCRWPRRWSASGPTCRAIATA